MEPRVNFSLILTSDLLPVGTTSCQSCELSKAASLLWMVQQKAVMEISYLTHLERQLSSFWLRSVPHSGTAGTAEVSHHQTSSESHYTVG